MAAVPVFDWAAVFHQVPCTGIHAHAQQVCYKVRVRQLPRQLMVMPSSSSGSSRHPEFAAALIRLVLRDKVDIR